MAEGSPITKEGIDRASRRYGFWGSLQVLLDAVAKGHVGEPYELELFHYLFDRYVELPAIWNLTHVWDAHPHVLEFYLSQEVRPPVVEDSLRDLSSFYANHLMSEESEVKPVVPVLERHPQIVRGWSRGYSLYNLCRRICDLGVEEGTQVIVRALQATGEVLDNLFFQDLLQHVTQLDEESDALGTQEFIQVVQILHPFAEDSAWFLSVLVTLGYSSNIAPLFEADKGLAQDVANLLQGAARDLNARHPPEKNLVGPSIWDHLDD